MTTETPFDTPSHALLLTLLNAFPGDVTLIDVDGTILVTNEAGAHIISSTVAESVGINFFDTHPPSHAQLHRQWIAEVVRSKKPVHVETERIGRRLRESFYPITDQGVVIQVLAVSYDVTREVQAEHERSRLTETAAQQMRILDGILSSSPEHIYIYDREMRYRFASKSALATLGLKKSELIGKTWRELNFSREHMGPLEVNVQRVFGTGTSMQGEMVWPSTGGERVYEYVLSPIYNLEGEVDAVISATRDITERKRVEAALKDAERLAGIGETTTMIGHDLRNPLQALQYTLELERIYFNAMSADAKADPRIAKATQLFSNMEQQIQYMDKIVSDLQDYARPLKLEAEETRIAALIDTTLSVLTIPKSISVHVDVPTPITATVDPYLMQRVLANLVLNAVQAMPHGGELAIRALMEGDAVTLTVRDTGQGVPYEMKDKLFSPLTTGKAKGTGLGLAVVKRIVEAHNGTITFESEDEKGTTFMVTVPASRAA
ncbi:MAG: PAS domain-containing protein [Euryarchaeota archaeon]|nr:PAS domain-containing protein [Euryarchaeota archaeon]